MRDRPCNETAIFQEKHFRLRHVNNYLINDTSRLHYIFTILRKLGMCNTKVTLLHQVKGCFRKLIIFH